MTTSALLIAFEDAIGEGITPTGNAAATAASGFPLSRLGGSQLFQRYRGATGSLTDLQLSWDLGSSRQLNVAMIAGTNLTANATRRVRFADDSGFTSGVVESGASLTAAFDATLGTRAVYVPPWGRTLIYVHSSVITKRYARWHLTDTGNPDNRIELAIARFGLGWQPGTTFDDSWRAAPKLFGPPGAEKVLRGHELTLHVLTKEEAYSLQAMALTMLSTRRVLVIPEPLAPATWRHDALWCVLEEAYVREPVPGTRYTDKRYRVVLTFREVDQ